MTHCAMSIAFANRNKHVISTRDIRHVIRALEVKSYRDKNTIIEICEIHEKNEQLKQQMQQLQIDFQKKSLNIKMSNRKIKN